MKADVVVVGAGPSGCAATSVLAARGLRVALVDRARFPRDKVCGDAVSPYALAYLHRLGLGPWARENGFQQPEGLVLCFPSGRRVTVARHPALPDLGRVIPRSTLDRALLDHAIAQGIRLLEGTRATGAAIDDRGVAVQCLQDGHPLRIEAQMVLAADGSTAAFSRRLGIVRDAPALVGARAYVQGEKQSANAYHVFFLRALLPAYAWIFPLGAGRYNVGMARWAAASNVGNLRLHDALRQFLASPHAGQVLGRAEQVGRVVGHPLRVWGLNQAQLSGRRALAIGDAAALVHPLSGEGIGPALESGLLAAEHTCRAFERGDFTQGVLSAYAADIRRRYGRDYRAAAILRGIMSRPFLADGAGHLGQSEPAFARMLAKAVLARSSARLFHPFTLLKGLLYWPLRAAVRGLLADHDAAHPSL